MELVYNRSRIIYSITLFQGNINEIRHFLFCASNSDLFFTRSIMLPIWLLSVSVSQGPYLDWEILSNNPVYVRISETSAGHFVSFCTEISGPSPMEGFSVFWPDIARIVPWAGLVGRRRYIQYFSYSLRGDLLTKTNS